MLILQTILGYNEPNEPGHANLSALEAVEEWLMIQEMYPERILVAPATSGIQTDWMDEFWAECELRGCRVDYLATHSYNIGQPNKTMEVSEESWVRTFYRTETFPLRYVCRNWKNSVNDTEERKFGSRSLLPKL